MIGLQRSSSPAIAEAQNNRGLVLHRLARPAEALASCDRAIALSPSLRAAPYQSRQCARRARPAAMKRSPPIDQALALSPDQAEAHLGRGKPPCDESRHDEALAANDHALALKPGLAEAWLGRGQCPVQTETP